MLDLSFGLMNSANAAQPGTWTFRTDLDLAAIDRTFANLGTKKTWILTTTLSGAGMIDASTVAAVGVKIGGSTVLNEMPDTLAYSQGAGIDLSLGRVFAPGVLGIVYGGYEYEQSQALITGVRSTFTSSTVKLGGKLQADMALDPVVLTPAVSVLLQFRNRPGFTDQFGSAFVASDAMTADVSAGLTVSRAFEFAEQGVIVTPYLTGNLLANATSITPALTPVVSVPDAFKVQGVLGLKTEWSNGVKSSFQADLSRGVTAFSVGMSASVSMSFQ